MNVKSCFSERLKKLREECNLSQAALAEKIKLSRGSISFYENSERTPDIAVLDNIANFFDVSVEYLLGYTNARTAKDAKSVAETGLTTEAIKTLKQCKRYCPEVIWLLNHLLIGDRIDNLACLVFDYCLYLKELYKEADKDIDAERIPDQQLYYETEAFENKTGYKAINRAEYTDLLFFQIEREFLDIVERLALDEEE